MKVFAFSYFVVLVGVCLPGCRVHRQASLSTDLQENATRISHATRIHEDTVSVVSVATGSSSGIEWKYTETYYPSVPEDTVPKLKSRSWEGKRTSSDTNVYNAQNADRKTVFQFADTTDRRATASVRSVSEKEVTPILGKAFLKIGLIMIGLANRYTLGNEPSERALPPGVPLSTCSRIFAKHSISIKYIDAV